MKQKSAQKFENESQKIQLFCDSDTSLGELHDFLLYLKGNVVERMVKAHTEEEEESKKQSEQAEASQEQK